MIRYTPKVSLIKTPKLMSLNYASQYICLQGKEGDYSILQMGRLTLKEVKNLPEIIQLTKGREGLKPGLLFSPSSDNF